MFDLQLALARAGALTEDFQDQRRAVHDLAAKNFLEVAGLCRRKLIVENNRVHFARFAKPGEFLGLARANVGRGNGRGHFLHAFPDNFRAGGHGEFFEFRERFTDIGGGAGFEFHANEKDAYGARVAGLDE